MYEHYSEKCIDGIPAVVHFRPWHLTSIVVGAGAPKSRPWPCNHQVHAMVTEARLSQLATGWDGHVCRSVLSTVDQALVLALCNTLPYVYNDVLFVHLTSSTPTPLILPNRQRIQQEDGVP